MSAPLATDMYTGYVPPDTAALAREAESIARDLGTRYQLNGFVARGGFASVWSVTDRKTNEELAVKRLDPRLGRRRDFYRELRAMFVVRDPNVVQIVNLLEAQGTRYLFLELCRGGSLRAAISRARKAERMASPMVARAMIGQIASGLRALHQQGFTHRDLKPENVLFAQIQSQPFQSVGLLKLADFGLTDLLTAGDAILRGLTGSPAYMAPEQFSGQAIPASDIYALGVIALELITGDVPFLGSPEELAAHHIFTPPPIPQDLPKEWVELLKAMLAKDPTQRPTAAMIIERTGHREAATPPVRASSFPEAHSMNSPPIRNERNALDREARRAKAALNDLAALFSSRRASHSGPISSISRGVASALVPPSADGFFGDFESDSPPIPGATSLAQRIAEPIASPDRPDILQDWFADDADSLAAPAEPATASPPPSLVANDLSSPPLANPNHADTTTPPAVDSINDILDSFQW